MTDGDTIDPKHTWYDEHYLRAEVMKEFAYLQGGHAWIGDVERGEDAKDIEPREHE